MRERTFKYVFGPVPSRRLGRSLGVDLVPHKTCTYDCIYCQVGLTTNKTAVRQEFVPMDEVLAEIDRKLEAGAQPDYITISGSGEPTLYSRLGELITALKRRTGIPVAVITNGSLLWDPQVRDELLAADLVMPSLDAADPETFQRANRPHPDIPFDKMVQGLIAFRRAYHGQLWLEVFLLAGVTDTEEVIRKLAVHIGQIAPDRIQLNTVVRPPAESSARPLAKEQMERFADVLGCPAEVIASYDATRGPGQRSVTGEEVLGMLKRRPCSLDDVAEGLSIHRTEAAKLLDALVAERAVATELRGGILFYVAKVEAHA